MKISASRIPASACPHGKLVVPNGKARAYTTGMNSKASYAYDNNNFYSFDDYKSIMYKNNYINDMSLGGFMYWFIGGDDSDNTLLNAINKKKSNSKSNIKNASSTPHYLTTLKDIPNISLVNSITAYKYRMTLQSYNYNRRT